MPIWAISGRAPIRWAWLYFAFPALVLNYFGQGALLLSNPARRAVPVLCPGAAAGLHYPMVALATLATIIASQAVISGVFSITRQAVQLGQLPRMEIRHTRATENGPDLCAAHQRHAGVGVVLIVLIFKSSDALAAAYGIAVTGVMVISTAPGGGGGALSLEMEAADGDRRVRRAGPDRSRLPGLQRAQDRAGRLAAAGGGGRRRSW